jgi:hypothetical protein
MMYIIMNLWCTNQKKKFIALFYSTQESRIYVASAQVEISALEMGMAQSSDANVTFKSYNLSPKLQQLLWLTLDNICIQRCQSPEDQRSFALPNGFLLFLQQPSSQKYPSLAMPKSWFIASLFVAADSLHHDLGQQAVLQKYLYLYTPVALLTHRTLYSGSG